MGVLKGPSNYWKPQWMVNVESNLISLFDWGMLENAAFYNMYLPTSGAYGGSPARLRLSEDPNYLPGQVFEGYRANWVYETGISTPVQPIQISGVYINGTFNPVTGVVNPFIVDYPRGRIIFTSPILTNSVVTCEYSYKHVQWASPDIPWYRKLMFGSFRIDDFQFLQQNSGQWAIPEDRRIQLPAVIVEMLGRRQYVPWEIGGGSQINQDVRFHIFAETDFDRKQLMDVIGNQYEGQFRFYDRNLISNATGFPLDYNGSLVAGAQMYPQLIQQYLWRTVYFKDVQFESVETTLPLFVGSVRATLNVYTPEV